MRQTITIVLLGIYILFVTLVGIFNKHNVKRGSEDYFLASRKLPPLVLAITFIASWWGGGSAIDLADHAYDSGINSFWIYGMPVLIATFLMFVFAKAIGTQVRSVLTISWIGSDFIATGVFVPLVLGFLWRRGTARAAVASMIFGLLFSSYNLLVALGAPFPTLWEIASVAQAFYGMGGSLIIFVSTSLLSKGNDPKAIEFIKQAGLVKSWSPRGRNDG